MNIFKRVKKLVTASKRESDPFLDVTRECVDRYHKAEADLQARRKQSKIEFADTLAWLKLRMPPGQEFTYIGASVTVEFYGAFDGGFYCNYMDSKGVILQLELSVDAMLAVVIKELENANN